MPALWEYTAPMSLGGDLVGGPVVAAPGPQPAGESDGTHCVCGSSANSYLGITFGLLVIRLQKRATFFCPMLAKLSKLGTSVLGPANVKSHFLVPRTNWHAPRFRSRWSAVELGSKVGSN